MHNKNYTVQMLHLMESYICLMLLRFIKMKAIVGVGKSMVRGSEVKGYVRDAWVSCVVGAALSSVETESGRNYGSGSREPTTSETHTNNNG